MSEVIKNLRAKNPLVICLTNDVVKNFTANGLIAIGASPAMSACKEDLEDLLKYALALLVNIGTADQTTRQLYKDAMEIANRLGVPAVLDPVACGASAFRMTVAKELLTHYKFALLRGNAGEIGALVGASIDSKGVDSVGTANTAELAKAASIEFGIPVVVTGEIDGVSDGERTVSIDGGSAMMPMVVGTGCLLGGVLAAFIGVNPDDPFQAAVDGMKAYNLAGELAEGIDYEQGPGTYAVNFIDELAAVDDELLDEYNDIEG